MKVCIKTRDVSCAPWNAIKLAFMHKSSYISLLNIRFSFMGWVDFSIFVFINCQNQLMHITFVHSQMLIIHC